MWDKKKAFSSKLNVIEKQTIFLKKKLNIKWHSIKHTSTAPTQRNTKYLRYELLSLTNSTKCRLISNDEYIGMNESAGQTQLKSFTISQPYYQSPALASGIYVYVYCCMAAAIVVYSQTHTHATYGTGQLYTRTKWFCCLICLFCVLLSSMDGCLNLCGVIFITI